MFKCVPVHGLPVLTLVTSDRILHQKLQQCTFSEAFGCRVPCPQGAGDTLAHSFPYMCSGSILGGGRRWPWGHLGLLALSPASLAHARVDVPLHGAPEGLDPPGCMCPTPDAARYSAPCRVTQLLEHLSEVVEQSNLFDPEHPGLEEELESLRRRLEALSSSEPSSMETHFSSWAGQ